MKNIFFSFFVFFIFVLFASVRYQLALPYAYYFLSFVIGIFLIVMIYRSNGKKQWSVFLSIVIVCIFLRSVYLIASGFSLIPLSDGYGDYATARIFLDNGRSFVITSGIGAYNSGWPLLHILAVSLSEILNVDLFQVVLVLPIIFSVAILAFMYLLIREIVPKLGVSQRVVPLALLIYAISPDFIYTSMQFVRQSFALFFVTTIFYLMYKHAKISVKSGRIKLLFLIFSSSLVLAHCLSTFTIFLFFFLFLILTQISNQVRDKIKWKIQSIHSISLATLTLFSVTMFTWWTYHSPIVVKIYLPWLSWGIQPSVYTGTLELAMTSWRFYGILRPEPYANLLTLYYIAVYVPLVISFLIFIKKIITRKKIVADAQFLAYSVTAFFTIFLVYEFLLNMEPLRVLWVSAPFIALFTALLYDRLFSSKKALWRILAASLLIMVAFTTFLAPWSRGYMPLYVYDSSVRFEDVGHHNPHYLNVVPFVKDHIQDEKFEAILSDDPALLYIVLPTGSYSMVRNIYYNPGMINDTNIILFEFIHLNPSFHAVPYVYMQNPDILENTEAFKHQIMTKFNVVYDDGSSKIHLR